MSCRYFGISRQAECTVAEFGPEYADLHADCRQPKDVPLIHSGRILLVHRCRCACHRGK
ncbi:hypothetical protein GCM10017771_89700 [Streptomyces capitiformicae]|uniref:Uncharacterized protein n=1 Tax=Streptomyces capitiformicae TaxID=2014920 RepID=A0A918ZR65_9ACTN|nr:hypothetical protein [Streptomyces capitiformicae]GHE66132.1 hypothetical protein GCM10017771_89700 [Streptomyces capitiformicae]